MSVEDGRRPARPEPWDTTRKPRNNLERLIASAPAAPCTCPSGDGSLRWPCPTHPNANYTRLSNRESPSVEQGVPANAPSNTVTVYKTSAVGWTEAQRPAVANRGAQKPAYGPDNPPRLRMSGESVEEYRIAMGWDRPKPATPSVGGLNRKPLTAAMDNVLAWRLGEIANKAMDERAGDYIDRGLILLDMLNKRGFAVTHDPSADQGRPAAVEGAGGQAGDAA